MGDPETPPADPPADPPRPANPPVQALYRGRTASSPRSRGPVDVHDSTMKRAAEPLSLAKPSLGSE